AFFYFLLLDRLHQHPVSERFYVNCCHRLFTPSGFLFGLSRRLSISRQSPANYFGYFFLSSSTTSNSASTTSPSRLPAPSSAPGRAPASGPGCGPAWPPGAAWAEACL